MCKIKENPLIYLKSCWHLSAAIKHLFAAGLNKSRPHPHMSMPQTLMLTHTVTATTNACSQPTNKPRVLRGAQTSTHTRICNFTSIVLWFLLFEILFLPSTPIDLFAIKCPTSKSLWWRCDAAAHVKFDYLLQFDNLVSGWIECWFLVSCLPPSPPPPVNVTLFATRSGTVSTDASFPVWRFAFYLAIFDLHISHI